MAHTASTNHSADCKAAHWGSSLVTCTTRISINQCVKLRLWPTPAQEAGASQGVCFRNTYSGVLVLMVSRLVGRGLCGWRVLQGRGMRIRAAMLQPHRRKPGKSNAVQSLRRLTNRNGTIVKRAHHSVSVQGASFGQVLVPPHCAQEDRTPVAQ